ncbi:MAG: DUF2723 domain-containing protein [Verrucomicrobiota bacterium]
MAKQPNDISPAPQPVAAAETRRVFTPVEWLVAGLAFVVSGLVYFYYMSPEVTLEDSGELVTGAFNFGVPHPPGYPLWAFMGWLWRYLVPFGNPAWRICLMSVLTGATLVGIMTLLMSRSILMLLRNVTWADKIEESLKSWLSLTIGVAAAMLFAFNRGVWLWACVPEMRVLNAFLFVLISCMFFAWMMRPEKSRYLYATLLLLGLSIANHQTIVVMAFPFLVGAFAVGWLAEHKPGYLSGFLELTFALLVGWAAGVLVNAWLLAPTADLLWMQKVRVGILFGPPTEALPVLLVSGGAAAALLVLGASARWLNWRRAVCGAGLFLLGCGMYAYMPLAAATNPPMNWGYCATKQGFLHAITRGQYEQLHTSPILSFAFLTQIRLFTEALINQYSWPVALFALLPMVLLVCRWNDLRMRGRQWLIYVFAAIATTSFGLLMIINPGLDKTQQEINMKFFAPAHGFFAMLIGYGIALAITWALARWPQLPRSVFRYGSLGLVALAIIPFTGNWKTCEQRGHDFGYQFGYRMFYPGGDYPPMDRDAFLFGGTDPGRFVPTYMIFSESVVPARDKFRDPNLQNQELNFDRRDVYIVTQNALADTTYMAYIRDHYDYSRPTNYNAFARAIGRAQAYPVAPIWIPTELDSQRAFQEYVADVQSRRARGEPQNPDEDVTLEGGRVQVRGVKGVMNINAILCKWIHDHNKAKHTFYVEESYVIDWMFQYLEPYGIIMKINAEPLPSPSDNPVLWSRIFERDKAYWDKLVAEFTARPEFWRDNDARKTFSKLRSAIGGVYAYRKLYDKAQYAYQQSLQLCPDSPEANFRTSQLYLETGHPDAAIAILEAYKKLDPLNSKIELAINQIRGMQQAGASIQQLEQQLATQPHNLQLVGELAKNYLRVQQFGRVQALFDNFVAQPATTVGDMLQIAQFYLSINQAQLAVRAIEQATQRFPQEADPFYALAILRGAMGAPNDALGALQRAIQINPAVRARAQSDQQFAALRNDARFQALVASQ